MSHILVTGGAGFIGSHTLVALAAAGYDAVVIDNLSNSSRESLERVHKLTGREVSFIEGDILDPAALDVAFGKGEITAVIHFAGLKAVGESVESPRSYYENNFTGTLRLLEAMDQHGCKQIVFSSSSTVYGEPKSLPIKEDAPLGALNPYGRTKLFIEEMLRDICVADPSMRVALLRYFNPVGAHESGDIGEDPGGVPNNLMPYIMQVAVGRLDALQVFGNDYPTPDGTGVRDYIHVMDLAEGHVAALKSLAGFVKPTAINLGTGVGYSVLDVLKAASAAVGRELPHVIKPRRSGDASSVYADASLAKLLLGWTAKRDLAAMARDAWSWQQKNPNGYR